MRLRFKICQGDSGSSKSFSISLDDTCDWQQLQAALLIKQPQLEGRNCLSLNKKDCLHAGASDKVKSLGIRSGDLIWIMAQNTTQLRDTQRMHGNPSTRQVQSTDWGAGDATCAASTGRIELPGDLATAVHQILLDEGLQHMKDTIATGQPGDLTAGLQAYVLPRTAADGAHTFRQACCTVRYIHLGKSLVVWAATESMGTRSVCLSPDAISTAVAGSTEQGVVLAQTASHRIHDELLLPVLQALCQEEGLSPPSSLRTLPMEIRMLILHSLPAKELALLACTCKDFKRLASSEELWEKLFRREFASAHVQPQEVSRAGWKGLFANAWRERSERRRHRQSLRVPPSRLPWPGGAGPFASRSPALPGIVGGDFDRLPHPLLNIPRPYGRTFGGGFPRMG
ncbi:g3397 [Coccomyxa viridis]|uniref:G3397 protein n=1 Tax=Coccomyxa viridis TaxID=1274662 RepID=A0ABP1FMP7_9CHLO